MTTGAPPPNLTFMSTKRIVPNLHVKTNAYNAAGFIDHPLAKFGRIPRGPHEPNHGDPRGGPIILPFIGNPAAAADKAGKGPATHVGGSAWDIGHPHTVTGREHGADF